MSLKMFVGIISYLVCLLSQENKILLDDCGRNDCTVNIKFHCGYIFLVCISVTIVDLTIFSIGVNYIVHILLKWLKNNQKLDKINVIVFQLTAKHFVHLTSCYVGM